ncbi:hypothetical protein LTR39_000334 [Cryomyces antarcticus]|nr:hypothetical protein LTR39_000334 [Cryomyces antarcticus]
MPGLGAEIAHHFAAAGCTGIALNYATREQPAVELAKKLETDFAGVKAVTIQGDAGVLADCVKCVRETIEAFGGLDIIIGNAVRLSSDSTTPHPLPVAEAQAPPKTEQDTLTRDGAQGWTKFSTFGDLDALPEEDWDKCWAVNVKGQMALLREAMPTFNANPEGGVFIITSSIAGVSLGGSSMPYSVTKAAQLHLMKCMAQTQGPKVRINAVLPGLLLTDWGNLYPPEAIKNLKERAVLKDVTDLSDCADAYVMIARNTSMTGQSVQIDAGLNVANM